MHALTDILPHATLSYVRGMCPFLSAPHLPGTCSTMMSMITELLLIHLKQQYWETKVPPLYQSQTRILSRVVTPSNLI